MEDFEPNIVTASEENVLEAHEVQTMSSEEARERLNTLLQEGDDDE